MILEGLKALLAEKGYDYHNQLELVLSRLTGEVVGHYDISYAVRPDGDKLRIGCTDLILASNERGFVQNEAWTRLPDLTVPETS